MDNDSGQSDSLPGRHRYNVTVLVDQSLQTEEIARIISSATRLARQAGGDLKRGSIVGPRRYPMPIMGREGAVYFTFDVDSDADSIAHFDRSLHAVSGVLVTRVSREKQILGRIVRRERIKRGLTAEEAAHKAGIAYATWLRIESGKRVRDMSLAAVDRVFDLEPGTTLQAKDAPDGLDIALTLQRLRSPTLAAGAAPKRQSLPEFLSEEEQWKSARGTDDAYNQVLAAMSALDADQLEEVGRFALNLARLYKFASGQSVGKDDNGER
ncbi:ribosomal protein S6 [Saccharomonospora amisosensis]|uniref:Small ribosomal subunit protein bS6 n=1 Tax=Saccharomonospora amisosensis TaxID=1128677 RepID=A0A7X5UM80_9PSEU|nr:30S ribosomal protein S6 [Saccharomonospora amisosensis]NIJ10608.1 ribosomal protein S6 [Saccharomonospora amisosensis]